MDDRVHRLTDNLQGTTRNLRSLDRMLDSYRDVTREQRSSVDRLRDEVSRTNDQVRRERARSPSYRDYGSDSEFEGSPTVTRRRRKRSSTVRFADDMNRELHTLNNSLRDLSNDHIDLGHQFQSEVGRRERGEYEARRTMKDISETLKKMPHEDPVASRVERRLNAIQNELRGDRDRHAYDRYDELLNLSTDLRQAINQNQHYAQQASDERVRNQYLQSEANKIRVESDLDNLKRKLDQSEGGKVALQAQVDELRSQLHRIDNEKGRLKQQMDDSRYEDETQPPPDPVAQFAKGYEDYLQSPLQPLMDNLESQTYEIFEKDPVKYSQYQKAVYHALLDKVKPEERDTKEIVLMVVGAGRGPLVRASIAAAQQAGRKVKKIYAVEKNPNAVITLENMKDEMWGDQVEVISCDMRKWEAPQKADILVSELLGSFADNELSPECLDGAQRFLKEDGISIPCEYTSFLAPLQSEKLHNEVRNCKDKDKQPDHYFEMPYVVRLHNCQVLDEPKKVFVFKHPNKDEVIDNSRHISLDFDIQNDALLHGFSGYFETVLYGDINLSILPSTHSQGMFSWFPIYFPIKTPLFLKKGDTVSVDIWRCVSEKNVWYEWAITKPQILPIHNPKGRSYTIGL
ncbi:type II protein arginine methyltransferase [Mytilus galloprovincialis]|uniref:Type II protein arginine methyltransferase n=1 Tax=Mytilus galloprovincialis TaxID=29158 RepID=A0A8B6BMR9_MYTGA|nr:type II protein arginine methyltransferase [Mytilus galloprovincialis]